MTAQLKTQLETHEICAKNHDYGKLKVELPTDTQTNQGLPVVRSSRVSEQISNQRRAGGMKCAHQAMQTRKVQAMPDNIKNSPEIDAIFKRAGSRSVELDFSKYEAYLDDPSLSEAQKADIIEALWQIVATFVELGFGAHPVQQACGQVDLGLDQKDNLDSPMLDSG